MKLLSLYREKLWVRVMYVEGMVVLGDKAVRQR